jgi:stage V sporulation protein R
MTWRDWLEPLDAAARRLGLRPRPCVWEEVPVDAIYRMAAYMLPGMYAHWSRGRDVWRMRQRFETGEEHLYELVVNTRPARAYLLDHNSLGEQIFVLAHVQGHLDFFDRNAHMAAARADMEALLRPAADRFRRYEEEHGLDAVERVIEVAQALSWHACEVSERPEREAPPGARDYPLRDLDELLGRPAPAARSSAGGWRRGWRLPCPDMLWFLARHAPLEEWERDVLQVVREVGLHVLPQARTKVMDEGWAVYWGLRLMSALDVPPEVHLIASRLHAQVASPHPLRPNPYWLGWRLWEHLDGQGRDLPAICAVESDASFLRNWVDAEFVRRERLYLWEEVAGPGQGSTVRVKSREWEAVRDRLADLAALPIPYVHVADVGGDRTLHLRSEQGPLDARDAREIVRGVCRLWRGAVELRAGPQGEQRIACKPGEED